MRAVLEEEVPPRKLYDGDRTHEYCFSLLVSFRFARVVLLLRGLC